MDGHVFTPSLQDISLKRWANKKDFKKCVSDYCTSILK